MDEKTKYYYDRTINHIHLVHQRAVHLITRCSDILMRELDLDEEDLRTLMLTILKHDSSKFSRAQYQSYIDFSWAKFNEDELSLEEQQAFEEAWEDHYLSEGHHPEGDCMFDTLSFIEMACDLMAMSEEFGEASCRGYFEKTWVPKYKKAKWKDIDEAIRVINICIDCFEEK